MPLVRDFFVRGDNMNYGDIVTFTNKLRRSSQDCPHYVDSRFNGSYGGIGKCWKKTKRNGSGIFLGYRNLANGQTVCDPDGWYFVAKEYIKVALVSPSDKENPIYIHLDDITAA
jgi:hypothetical protein